MASKKTCDLCEAVESDRLPVVTWWPAGTGRPTIELCVPCFDDLIAWMHLGRARHPNDDNDPTWTREEMGLDK